MQSRVNIQRSKQAAFTIVEMLVTIVVTLLMMLAVVQLFGWLGSRVAQGRALIEMSGTMRTVARRLELDLQTCTVPVRPWLDPSAGEGYFEYYEGAANDLSEWNTMVAAGPPIVPESLTGDLDDILMFTARNRDEPFNGHRRYVTLDSANNFVSPVNGSITSDVGEIVWWTQWEDSNNDGVPAKHEFTLRRKALLIRPDLNNINGYMTRLVGSNITNLRELIVNFMHQNDISVRMQIDPNNNLNCIVSANSLSDLTIRANRYAHWRILNVLPNLQYATMDWPHPIDTVDDFVVDHDLVNGNVSATSLRRLAKSHFTPTFANEDCSRYGEDVMMSGVLGFDIRVYDPEALIFNMDGTAVTPGDPGWGRQLYDYILNPMDPTKQPIGKGAFVDLGYLPRPAGVAPTVTSEAGQSFFSDVPDVRSGLQHWVNNVNTNNPMSYWMIGTRSKAFDYNQPTQLYNNSAPLNFDRRYGIPRVYDTWPDVYERDGFQQSQGRIILPPTGTVDPGTDGFDNNGLDGPDDNGERETAPPYPFKLRGIQITIRAYEHDTRQVKQNSVSANFVPE